MSQTVGELLVSTLADIGATQVFGVVGDALNPFTDALRRDKRMSWLGVRHEEGAALAAAGLRTGPEARRDGSRQSAV